MSGLVGCTRTREICCVSASPREVHVLPPSVVFQTPSPAETLPRMGYSPVPTYTTSGFDSETPIAPRARRRRPRCVANTQSYGIGKAGISRCCAVIDDFASAPRPVSARSHCLSSVFTSPSGTSRDAHTSPPSSVVSCSARNVPAGTVTDSQPTTCAPAHREAQSKADVFCPPFGPIIPAISPELLMAGCEPPLMMSARGASSPDARLAVRICTTPFLLGSFPANFTSNQYSVESPDRSEPTTARRIFPPEPPPVPSNDAH